MDIEIFVCRGGRSTSCARGAAVRLGLSLTTTIQGSLDVLFLGFTPVSKPQGSLSLEMLITAETPSWDQVAIPAAWPGPELQVETDSWR